MSELLPCPFCGGEAEYGLTMAGEEACCKKCHAAMPRLTTKAEAIAAWNSRAERVTDDEWESYKHSVPATEENMAKFGWVRERTCRVLENDDLPYAICSECGAIQPDDFTVYYCWACGAKVVDK